jgi:hypothetical protein
MYKCTLIYEYIYDAAIKELDSADQVCVCMNIYMYICLLYIRYTYINKYFHV